MFRHIIHLKQHTPMIHFQHYEDGATIRATELKPKLDKFLIKYAFENDFEKYKCCLIGWNNKKSIGDYENNKPLDYKLKININQNEKKKPPAVPHKLFFGNIGLSENEKSKTVFTEDIITICFFSFSPKLIEIIKNNFVKFVAITNFGTRQNKGFGSFYLLNEETNYLNVLKENLPFFLYLECNTNENFTNKLNHTFNTFLNQIRIISF